MNCQIILLIFVSSPFFCVCQTILFHDLMINEEVNIESTDFNCEVSNSTKSLHLNYTGLQYLPANFIDTVSINCVNLEGNQLSDFDSRIFANFPNMTFLNLANNDLMTARLFRIRAHEKLQTLILDHNSREEYSLYFKQTPEIVGQFTNLQKLYLRRNHINSFDASFREANFPKLTHLYLSDNTEKTGELQQSVANIPKSLLLLENENNGICRFNGSVFKNMTTLFIGGNQFLILGTSGHSFLNVQNMPNLKILSATCCDIREMKIDAFNGTNNIQELNLTVNNIDHISDGTFNNMTSLKILTLNYNRLRKIPKVPLSSLKKFYLNFNSIVTIEKDSLNGLINLEKLSLKGNRIRVIEKDGFAHLEKLTQLDLRENELNTFYVNWGKKLKNLKNLNVIANHISSIELLYLENSFLENVFIDNNMRNITFFKNRKNLTLHFYTHLDSGKSTDIRYQYFKSHPVDCRK